MIMSWQRRWRRWSLDATNPLICYRGNKNQIYFTSADCLAASRWPGRESLVDTGVRGELMSRAASNLSLFPPSSEESLRGPAQSDAAAAKLSSPRSPSDAGGGCRWVSCAWRQAWVYGWLATASKMFWKQEAASHRFLHRQRQARRRTHSIP